MKEQILVGVGCAGRGGLDLETRMPCLQYLKLLGLKNPGLLSVLDQCLFIYPSFSSGKSHPVGVES